MPSVITLEGPKKAKALGETPRVGECKCVRNKRTGRWTKLCYVGQRKGKRGSGWLFKKGDCTP